MHKPQPGDVPSEQTVEVLSDHFLLAGLNRPSAWVFCPTRPQEQWLGYDGSLQNGKIVIIQYKRIQVNRGGNFRIPIARLQHGTLRNNFHQGTVPYVFYGFSRYGTYRDLDAGFHARRAPRFFANMRFVDLHNLPANCAWLAYSVQHGVRPCVKGQLRAQVPSVNGNQLVDRIAKCTAGLTVADALTVLSTAPVSWTTETPHTSIFMLPTRRTSRRSLRGEKKQF